MVKLICADLAGVLGPELVDFVIQFSKVQQNFYRLAGLIYLTPRDKRHAPAKRGGVLRRSAVGIIPQTIFRRAHRAQIDLRLPDHRLPTAP